MTYTIRPSTSDDYQAIADLVNASKPNFPLTAERLKADDDKRPAHLRFGRWVVEQNNQLIGVSAFAQYSYNYEPGVYTMSVRIHPDHEHHGIGRALYETVEQASIADGATRLKGQVNEGKPRGMKFAQAAGYMEYARRFDTILDLTTFDSTPYEGVVEGVLAQGIEIRPYPEVAETISDLPRRLYDLQMPIEADVPLPDPFTPPSYEEYESHLLTHPAVPHDGIFIATYGDELIGLIMHYRADDKNVNIDFTGVRCDYRKRGIALALKLIGIDYAQSKGYHRLLTTNDPANPGIVALNDRLGFVREPAWVQMIKPL